MKRLFVLLLVITMSLVLLVGCSKNAEPAASSDTSDQSAVESSGRLLIRNSLLNRKRRLLIRKKQ